MAYIDTERDSFPTFHQKELNDYMKGWNTCLKSVLQQAPTADVVEVARCVNCCFYDIEKYNCREFDCNMPCDGYCSKGTPKERGGEK